MYSLGKLPPAVLPEIAFAGRSNVGKSSLINRLVNRRKLVKVSARPGKTQSLNFFLVDQKLYFVDLPGYGYAKVPKKLKADWQDLITSYLETRQSLCCVVVIVDIRHEAKAQDRDIVAWLMLQGIPFLPVYTKIDKLSKNERFRQAAMLDAAFHVKPGQRLLFSAKTGEGTESLLATLEDFL